VAAEFFPRIARRAAYSTKANGEHYEDYHRYDAEIAQDCQHRCVYCDITLEEDGGEGMHVDHFRPRKHFPHLGNDPANLVLACANCNLLKSAHWPMTDPDITHDGNVGFVDPFEEDRLTVFGVSTAGRIEAVKGPADYGIQLLQLNRPSRVAVRQRRHQQDRVRVLCEKLAERMKRLHAAMVAK
jgi:uncharacterized protein (TIGR02646 family)